MPSRGCGSGLGGQGFGYGGRYNIVEARQKMFAARQGLVSDREMGRGMDYQIQPYPDQQYPNEKYPNQQYGGYGGSGRGAGVGVGFGGPFVLVNGVKRILRHVS
jgi:hypothetical protein